jgi:hypothetical protein
MINKGWVIIFIENCCFCLEVDFKYNSLYYKEIR